MTTEQLVLRAQAGDRSSRETLARLWLSRVRGAALALLGNAADADDLTQEAFLRAFRALPTLRDRERFGPWLLRIVRNAAKDRYRRRVLEPETRAEVERHARDAEPEGAALHAWRALDDEARLVCWLKIMDGLRLVDIAELLGCSKSAVHRTYTKGLARMRKEVTRC
jgi:RNA polymerase sigma-70 factor (ECF subfamily)